MSYKIGWKTPSTTGEKQNRVGNQLFKCPEPKPGRNMVDFRQCRKAVCDGHAQRQECERWGCWDSEGPGRAGLSRLRKDFEFYAILPRAKQKAIPLF